MSAQCHPERSEGSHGVDGDEILRFAQDDSYASFAMTANAWN
jgi:hypothetical protein